MNCEVQARGKGKNLPAFYDFRRNDEKVQALLLKRFASRIGIALKMPKTSSRKVNVIKSVPSFNVISHDSVSNCERKKRLIRCGKKNYRLAGNRSNKQLKPEVLTANNRMGLPSYRGSLSDAQAVDEYLRESYQHYLFKMLEIGLGGVTLSYGKFAYLFNDLNSKGVGFSERFETIFTYLKLDKQKIAVPVKSTVPAELALDDCYRLDNLLLCWLGMDNFIFVSE
ncbi:MAG: hypothetical protein V3T17_16995 [Pseudomonadales bacterium]